MIYLKLKAALKLLLTNVTEIKSIDWYNQQYLNTEKEDPETYPAVYIEFQNPLNWKQAGNYLQTAEAVIILHIVANTLKSEPDKLLTIVDAVQLAINGKVLSTGNEQMSTELIRSATDLVTRHRNLKVFKLTLKTELFDTGLMPPVMTLNGNIGLNITTDEDGSSEGEGEGE